MWLDRAAGMAEMQVEKDRRESTPDVPMPCQNCSEMLVRADRYTYVKNLAVEEIQPRLGSADRQMRRSSCWRVSHRKRTRRRIYRLDFWTTYIRRD